MHGNRRSQERLAKGDQRAQMFGGSRQRTLGREYCSLALTSVLWSGLVTLICRPSRMIRSQEARTSGVHFYLPLNQIGHDSYAFACLIFTSIREWQAGVCSGPIVSTSTKTNVIITRRHDKRSFTEYLCCAALLCVGSCCSCVS